MAIACDRLLLDGLPPYEPCGETGLSPAEARAYRLLAEVRCAFSLYARHVRDSGLFDAYPDGGPFGERVAIRLHGLSFTLDAAVPSRRTGEVSSRVAPSLVSTDAVLAELSAENGVPYEGLFEADPHRRVEVFWRGLDTLAHEAGMCVGDAEAFTAWCEAVIAHAVEGAEMVAVHLTDEQAKGYARAVLDSIPSLSCGAST